MSRQLLNIQQHVTAALQSLDQFDESHFGGVANAVKHRFGGKEPPYRQSVTAAGQFIFVPNLDAVAMPEFEKPHIRADIGVVSQVWPRRFPDVAQPRITPAKSVSNVCGTCRWHVCPTAGVRESGPDSMIAWDRASTTAREALDLRGRPGENAMLVGIQQPIGRQFPPKPTTPSASAVSAGGKNRDGGSVVMFRWVGSVTMAAGLRPAPIIIVYASVAASGDDLWHTSGRYVTTVTAAWRRTILAIGLRRTADDIGTEWCGRGLSM